MGLVPENRSAIVSRKLRRLLYRALPDTRRLRLYMRELDRTYRPLVEAEKDPEARDSLLSEWSYEAGEYESRLLEIETKWLIRRAQRLLIPVPNRPHKGEERCDENWDVDIMWGVLYLKPEARRSLMKQIRDEIKERRDYWLGWLPLIAALTGLLGATASVLALLR